MRYSGHETFRCRYPWIPKAYRILNSNKEGLSDDDLAIERLGVGKNMVRAIRFWVQVMGVAEPASGRGYTITPFGHTLFGAEGHDPFLEDVRTLWLLHWNVSTTDDPLFAWHYMLNHWQRPEIVPSIVVPEFIREANSTNSAGRAYSPVTLKQHFDVFMQVYVPTRSKRGTVEEDHLDSPLLELALIRPVGERVLGKRREPVYAFRREPKPDITPELFVYCLADFWRRYRPVERTLTFRDVAVAENSLGQVFKLPEADLRTRLESIERDSRGLFRYQESTSLAQVTRSKEHDLDSLDMRTHLLNLVYEAVSTEQPTG